ncbi:MAG: hypothetical protein IJY09_11135 [Lachnospiraceae bacterium]|nr:hypothetical protein [Lachnospiraceae bacterium]
MAERKEIAKRIYRHLRARQKIEHAWEDWSEYREALTEYLLKYTESGTTVAIFGAGECNDLNLRKLTEHFSNVMLYDYDEAALQEAVMRYGLEGDERLRWKTCDFAGITTEEYMEYAELLLMQNESGEINESLLLQKLECIYQAASERTPDFGTECYDYAIAIGIDSQLNNMAEWLRQTISGAAGDALTERIGMENERIVQRFHDRILGITRRQLFLGCERERLGMSGAIEGALQAFWDIEDRLTQKELQLINGFVIDWPFDWKQEIIYRMEIMNLKKLQ